MKPIKWEPVITGLICSMTWTSPLIYGEQTPLPVPPDQTAVSPADREKQATAGFDDGFFINSADGQHNLSVGGLFQTDGLFCQPKTHTSEFFVQRARLEISGAFNERFEFDVEPSFQTDTWGEEETYLAYNFSPSLKIKMGLAKQPFSLEEINSKKYADFAEFSLLNQFAPAEDSGVVVLGTALTGALDYGVSVFNGSGTADPSSYKDFCGRLVWHPCLKSSNNLLKKLQIGVDVTTGYQGEDISNTTIQNEVKQNIAVYSPGVHMDGERLRTGLEAAWLYGPWAVTSEFMSIKNDLALGTTEKSFANNVWYVAVSKVLTGEDKTLKGITPKKPFDPDKGNWGVWQVALRYSKLTLDDTLFSSGFMVPGASTSEAQSWTLGLNWWCYQNIVIRADLVRNIYKDQITVGNNSFSDENAMLLQFQLSF